MYTWSITELDEVVSLVGSFNLLRLPKARVQTYNISHRWSIVFNTSILKSSILKSPSIALEWKEGTCISLSRWWRTPSNSSKVVAECLEVCNEDSPVRPQITLIVRQTWTLAHHNHGNIWRLWNHRSKSFSMLTISSEEAITPNSHLRLQQTSFILTDK